MKVENLKHVLKFVHQIFPLPVSETFKGTHSIQLTDSGELKVLIWFKNANNEIIGDYVILEDHEYLDMDTKAIMGV